MNRRNFLAAALAAPWVVRSGVLMPVRKIVMPVAPGVFLAERAVRLIFGGESGVWNGFMIVEGGSNGGIRVHMNAVHPARRVGPDIVVGPSVAAILKG